jgi:hypothetical protein
VAHGPAEVLEDELELLETPLDDVDGGLGVVESAVGAAGWSVPVEDGEQAGGGEAVGPVLEGDPDRGGGVELGDQHGEGELGGVEEFTAG